MKVFAAVIIAATLTGSHAFACGMRYMPPPKPTTTLFAEAQLHDRQGRPEEAVYVYEEVAGSMQASQLVRGRAAFRAYELRKRLGFAEAARVDLQLAADMLPGRADVALAWGLMRLDDAPEIAQKALGLALKNGRGRERATALAASALLHARRGDHEQARALLERARRGGADALVVALAQNAVAAPVLAQR